MSTTPIDPRTMSRRRQILETYKMSREVDPAITWWMLGAALISGGLGFALFYFVLPGEGIFKNILTGIGTFLLALLGLMIVFGRRAQKAAFNRLDGQLGAGARALTMLRRGWIVEEVVGFTKQQDMVHRVVGPPGIVLVGEGNANRVKPLLVSETKKHERVLGDYPVSTIMVGTDEGQVPLDKLTKSLTKMKRAVKPAEITEIRQRLRALDAARPKVPLPRGPVPTSMKGNRGQLRGR